MSRDWWLMTWLVARREINDRTRAKSFWIASILLLVAVAAGAIIPALLQGHHSTARVGIVGGQTAALTATAREAGRISGTRVTVVPLPDVATARAQLRSGKVAAVLVGDYGVLIKQTSFNTGAGTLYGALAQIGGLQKLYAQLPPATATQIAEHGIALPVHGLWPPGRGLASRITGLSVAILIYIIILTYGIRITIGVCEEKATRVVEVLLTTLRPVQLLAGKVVGMGLLALAQIAAMVVLYLTLGHAVGSTQVRGASTSVVLAAGLWLVLGYAFYCTAYAAAGSLISRQSDAYNAAIPLQIPLILAYVLTNTVVYASSVNAFYHVLAFIPFTAPVAMPVLVAVGDAPAWQVAVSAVISLAATVWMARLAATIYSRAILRTGTRLKVRQVLRAAA
ncbi:MAG TPA: ABC transporter permease [Streptosporangiaceae bacterium]|nr:ABC transporter permease [Streptosporangiaceae bacterium]